jgi:hypothetical protein
MLCGKTSRIEMLKVGKARLRSPRRVQRRNLWCDSCMARGPFRPPNVGRDIAARCPYQLFFDV